MAVVLIVDDEPKVRALLRRVLEAAGHQTLEAEHAASALDTLAAHSANVVLCDVDMPGQDGLWLARRIREKHPTLPVVFATGQDMLPSTDTLRDGVVAYVLKPFERAALLAAVQRAVDWHEAAKSRGPSNPSDDKELDRWLRDDSSD